MRAAFAMRAVLPLAALASAWADAKAQDEPASRTRAEQIGSPAAATRAAERKAYLDDLPPAPQRGSAIQAPGGQIARPSRAPTPQITGAGESGPGVVQLAPGELDATLAQLSPVERQVLLQAIAGTDICDNPPAVAAVIALCRTRLETRAGDFAIPAPEVSAEERLMQFDLDSGTLPSVAQVIERLARSTAASDDFANQAIAAVALNAPAPGPGPRPEEKRDSETLSQETQALINALINQLGGSPP